jgi:hypothetical protein
MIEESDEDRRKREADRIEVPLPQPGDDPPTYGDEGGGNLFTELPLEGETPGPEESRLGFFRRLARRLGLIAPSSPRRPA